MEKYKKIKEYKFYDEGEGEMLKPDWDGVKIPLTEDKKKLQEGEVYNYIDNTYPESNRKSRDLIGKVAKLFEWDQYAIRSFCLQLMEDVNDHQMLRKTEKLFLTDFE